MSDPSGTVETVNHGAVRVQLDVTDVGGGMLLRAGGARRFGWNWAVAKIKANADQWAAEATYDIARPDRVQARVDGVCVGGAPGQTLLSLNKLLFASTYSCILSLWMCRIRRED